MPLSLRGVLEHPEHPPGYTTAIETWGLGVVCRVVDPLRPV
jgi:hypothetical protein